MTAASVTRPAPSRTVREPHCFAEQVLTRPERTAPRHGTAVPTEVGTNGQGAPSNFLFIEQLTRVSNLSTIHRLIRVQDAHTSWANPDLLVVRMLDQTTKLSIQDAIAVLLPPPAWRRVALFSALLVLAAHLAHAANPKGSIESDVQNARFYDEAGKLVREIPLTTASGDVDIEVRRFKGTGPDNKEDTIEEKVRRRVQVTAAKTNAILVESKQQVAVGEGGDGKELRPITASDSIELLDFRGQRKWRRDLRPNNEIFDLASSENGDIVTFIEGCNERCDRKDPATKTRLHAVGVSGSNVLTFSGSEKCSFSGGPYELSPTGRYAFIRCHSPGPQPTRTSVLDLQGLRVWHAEDLLVLFELKGRNRARVRRTTIRTKGGKPSRDTTWDEVDLDTVAWEPL